MKSADPLGSPGVWYVLSAPPVVLPWGLRFPWFEGGDPCHRSPGQAYKSASETTWLFFRNCSPMGPQNLENLPPEAFKKASWKESRHHCSNAFKLDPLNLPEVGEGSQKLGFSGFRKTSAHGAPKASFCEPFWLQNHSKVVPGEDPHK